MDEEKKVQVRTDLYKTLSEFVYQHFDAESNYKDEQSVLKEGFDFFLDEFYKDCAL